MPHASIALCAIVEAAYRLEALTKADDGADGHHHHAGDDAHGGDSCVAISARRQIQAHGCKAVQPLAGKGGDAAAEDFGKAFERGGEGAQTDADVRALAGHQKEQHKADHLAQAGGQRRAGNAHVKHEDKNGIKQDIKHRARADADHAIEGAALKAQLVVQHQRTDQEGHAGHQIADVLLCIGSNGLGGTQQIYQRFGTQQTNQHDQRAGQKSGDETGRRHGLRIVRAACAQCARHVVAGAVAEHEAYRLHDGHQRKDDAHSAGCAGRADQPHEVGIRHVVERGNQHGDDGRHG